jgi:fumarate hydratase subunit beta
LFLSDSHPKGLGAEALRRLEVEDFPVTVVNDVYGGFYEEGKAKYQVKAA